jgi:hypothetical protein
MEGITATAAAPWYRPALNLLGWAAPGPDKARVGRLEVVGHPRHERERPPFGPPSGAVRMRYGRW